jgi:alkanesulfonate monooxygenase SsuD/methylene tetrahydromethanopterin reductase-like flavin-dependent oxidoreductase (luciferase family)
MHPLEAHFARMLDRTTRTMRVGLLLPNVEGWFAGEMPTWSDLRELAQLAEQVGFDSVWTPDHLIFNADEPKGLWEAWSLLGALAACTHRIEIGPLVSCTSFRNPALLAKMADTVDEISGGRLILGLGSGYHEYEYRAFGYPFDHRVDRFAEALQVTHSLLRQGRVDFEGRYYRARDCELRPRNRRGSGPPILIGELAHAPRMLDLVARYADIWNAWSVNQSDLLPLQPALDAACRANNRDPASLQRSVAVLIDLPGFEQSPRAAWVTPFRSAFAPPIKGSLEEIAEHLGRFACAGIDHVQVWLEPSTAAAVAQFARVLEIFRKSSGALSQLSARRPG